jgi:uncharacterized tellurite resistance protein B-like protein|tara:strand:- start:270 stop:647 length:378 start_codon:yes stop_codon:yes gene_type:complete
MNQYDAIAKLMIATMTADGVTHDHEQMFIIGIIEILKIDEEKYEALRKEAEELDNLEELIEWCRTSIDEIAEKNKDTSGWNAMSILFMALVAMADNKIDQNEKHLIMAVAEELNVNIKSLESISE